ncbi:MAG: hypothetical protein ABIA63_11805, partial [bacterium]
MYIGRFAFILIMLRTVICTSDNNALPIISSKKIGSFEEPRPHTLVNQDFVKIKAAITDTMLLRSPGISEVRYYALPNVYTEGKLTKPYVNMIFPVIGKSSKPPYDIIWDLKAITDKYYGYWRLYAEVLDKSGNQYRIDPQACVQFSIDRNQAIKDIRLYSCYTAKQPFINKEEERFSGKFSTFVKGNNEIKFLSLWDMNNLYFWIKVKDEFLYADFDTSLRENLFMKMDTS